MDATYYKTIFKRKSFHLFRGVGSEKLSEAELRAVREQVMLLARSEGLDAHANAVGIRFEEV